MKLRFKDQLTLTLWFFLWPVFVAFIGVIWVIIWVLMLFIGWYYIAFKPKQILKPRTKGKVHDNIE